MPLGKGCLYFSALGDNRTHAARLFISNLNRVRRKGGKEYGLGYYFSMYQV